MQIRKLLLLLAALSATSTVSASKVKVTMNSISKTMSLISAATGESIDIGLPTDNVYEFEAPSGEYTLTAYDTDAKTVNGSINLNVDDTDDPQELKLITCTFYVNNKDAAGNQWNIDNGDYTADLKVNTRDGKAIKSIYGHSKTSGRYTFLAYNGNSYTLALSPSEKYTSNGYTILYKGGTLTANINVNGNIPKGDYFSITVPTEAKLQLGMKFTHFTDFTPVQPVKTEQTGDKTVRTYYLAENGQYNYRTSMTGGLTHAGIFTLSSDKTKRPVIEFTTDDYLKYSPSTINHDVQSNKGYETGDIFVNINERGYMNMNVGDTFAAHAMRTWELTNSATGNYFIEPDFHYSILDIDGKPSTGVIEVSQDDGSAWAKVKAIGKGTAILLVSYDAITVNNYNGSEKQTFLGGEFWGAIWPENTAAYVVTVGAVNSSVNPNMTINDDCNKSTLKVAGKYVDAEHDVFYYLDTDPGALYTFTPENAVEVSIAYPEIHETTVSYSGFGSDGVTLNEDNSYTLLLKEGRQIVRLTDTAGNPTYQVMTAKECHREITNESRPGSSVFLPGDKIKIQYSGLRHPANKLAGIYNMSAYVTYNNIPNGTSLIFGKNQYTFGSSESAQAVTVTIPDDYDISSQSYFSLTDGVIQVNGYGDPIGNHRLIDPQAGRSPNFTAVAHKTYFGQLPDVNITLGNSTAIKDIIDEEAVPLTYYNLQGVPSDKPFEGLNIVIYSDGSTRKIYKSAI